MDQLYELERTEARRRSRIEPNLHHSVSHTHHSKSARTSPVNTPFLSEAQLSHTNSVPSMADHMSTSYLPRPNYHSGVPKPSVSGLCHSGLASTAGVALGGPLPTPPACGHHECTTAYAKAVRLAQRGSDSGFNRSSSGEFLSPSINSVQPGLVRSHPPHPSENWADIQGHSHSFRFSAPVHALDNVSPIHYRESLQRHHPFHESSNLSSPGTPSSMSMEVDPVNEAEHDSKPATSSNTFTPSGSPFLGPLRSLALSRGPSAAPSRAPSPVLLPPPVLQTRNPSMSHYRDMLGHGLSYHHQSKSESHLRGHLPESASHFSYNHAHANRNALNTPNLSSGPSSASSPSSPRPSDPPLYSAHSRLPGISRESSPSLSRPPSPLTIAPRQRSERQASHNYRMELTMSPINPPNGRQGIASNSYHSRSIPPSRSGSPPITLPPLQTSDEQIVHGRKRKLDVQLPGFSELQVSHETQ
jgi:zinc finger protein CreA/MIG